MSLRTVGLSVSAAIALGAGMLWVKAHQRALRAQHVAMMDLPPSTIAYPIGDNAPVKRAHSQHRIPIRKEALPNPDSLSPGSFAHDVPRRMRQGKVYVVHAYVARGVIIPADYKPSTIAAVREESLHVVRALIPRYTDLVLQSDNGDTSAFHIQASRVNAVQRIEDDSIRREFARTVEGDYVMWSWNVTPLHRGENHRLSFLVFAIERNGMRVDTASRKVVKEIVVPVDVNYGYVAKTSALAIASHVEEHASLYGGGGFGGALALALKRRKRRQGLFSALRRAVARWFP